VDDQDIFTCAEVGIFNTPKIEVILISIVLPMRFYHLLELSVNFGQVLASLNTKSRLENYNIVCLFDIEFPYTKQLFLKLSTDQVRMMKSKWTKVSLFLFR
jgi:hypothetical protein